MSSILVKTRKESLLVASREQAAGVVIVIPLLASDTQVEYSS